MKKQSTYAISKKVLTLIIAAIISGGMSHSLYAQGEKSPGKGMDITYAGPRDKGIVFNVNYKNELSQPFELIVRNDQYQVIYIGQYGDKPLNKTMVFSEVPENCKLTFSILTGRKELSSQAFEIKSNVKTVEEYVVKGI